MKRKYQILLIISSIVVMMDQLTKALVVAKIPLYNTIVVIPGFFNLTHLRNPGVAFGLFSGGNSNLQQMLLMGAAICAVCVIFYFYSKTGQEFPLMLIGFSLIVGGAVGNLIDRFRFSGVVDFVEVYVGKYTWPAFNVADSAICIGVSIFFYYMVFKRPDNF
ncbi:MAG: signal peptidase II [Desulfobacteraceae bacterium]|nr:signal peptidase II [Desulfobacteraceae bacterium]MBU4002175.1 signal peptidase II [Pseudomonadota bacterium]MBU4052965.1 signal peptidase II [Pseudomonadota bacterium]